MIPTDMHDYKDLNGVNRQPSNGQKFNRQPSKKGIFLPSNVKKVVIISRQMISRSFKSHYFSCSFRTAGSQTERIVLTSTSSLHVPKYIYVMAFFANLYLNWQYNWFPSGSTSGYKKLMVNCIADNKKN